MSTSACSSTDNLRLFILRYGKRGNPVRDSSGQILYFNDKEIAKRNRDELNTGVNPPIFVVSNGPDHRPVKYKRK
jgi:hypothetical protein